VKFARSTPSNESCEKALAATEHLVRATMPRAPSRTLKLEAEP
jgi:hypothetical protein